MSGVQIYPAMPQLKRCQHWHYSGRRCGRSTRTTKLSWQCADHLDMDKRGDSRCTECRSMAEAFGLKL